MRGPSETTILDGGHDGSTSLPHRFTFTGRLRSVRHALRGIGVMLTTQHNAWVHLWASVAVVAVGLSVGLRAAEWVGLVLALVAVWTAEALNTALELLADVVSPEHHPLVGKAKDVAAGAVFLSAVGAVTIGLVVFVPRVREWLQW